ncbi:30S ribosomal protein S20 [Alkalicoccobacillus plakortidis]|uniref:Small ribosomal subunit protein bS20 n=1 Tax=Alkalicoccobacillus plakortidis TaxID=444060 RepID=A0ABT0XPN7_9BACI|nr:30S ribosomal protein S20 [Alkalicoccobacillus plakortidis]MCM2677870.1 30S ribosomal protein S20 [Alkalicoccobacillus plakortidis]
MANIKSAIKRVKTNDKRRAQNVAYKSALRTAIKNFEKKVEAGETEGAQTAFAEATKKIDKASSKGLIHKNNAARTKSRLAKQLNGLSA